MQEVIKTLFNMWQAYEDANENDYCTSEFPEYEGCRPDEIVNNMGRAIVKMHEAEISVKKEI